MKWLSSLVMEIATDFKKGANEQVNVSYHICLNKHMRTKKKVTIVVLTTDLVHECEYSRGLQVGNKVGLDPTPTLNLCEFGIGFGLVKK